jgi:carbamoyltransferase
MLLGAVVDHRRRLMSQNEQALFGIEKLKVARSQIPAVTRRLLGVRPDRAR